jgi:CubicO group peptidase (beta-lactamase class C family)
MLYLDGRSALFMDKDIWDSIQPGKVFRPSFPRCTDLISLAALPAMTSVALPAHATQALPTFVAYHDRSGADHQAQWDSLHPQGYRIISLSVYGDAASPLYAAVWMLRGGPAWVGIHNATAQQYQSFFDTWAAQGFGPTILSVAGSGSNLVFAAIAEQTSGPIPLTRYNLRGGSDQDSATIQYWNRWARENNFILRWASAYGTLQTPLYAGIWVPNAQDVNWNADGLGESAATYQARFDAQTQQWARPAFVTLAADQTYLSLFLDNQIGAWVARHDLTSSAYQAEFDAQLARGFYPICVQGGGVGSSRRFAAIFAKQEPPLACTWTVTGTAVPALAAVDQAVKSFMQATNTRATAVAIVRDRRLVFARGYTWAEPGYPITQPTSLFRIASCSKPLTAIAVMQLVQQGLLSLDDRVQSILNLQPLPGRTMDARFADIRVWQLLCHMGGWGRSQAPDLPYPGDVARALGIPLPVDKYQIARYMAGQPLQFTPGTQQEYSNFGFSLLGMLIERKRGQSYIEAVRRSVFAPLGVTRAVRAVAPLTEQAAGAVRQHDHELRVWPSVLSGDPRLYTQPLAPLAYGAEDYRVFDSFGGWELAAVDYAKVLAAFHCGADNPLLDAASVQTMWTVPGELAAASEVELPGYTLGWNSEALDEGGRIYSHGGAMPGVSAAIWHRTDGTSVIVFSNGGEGCPDINAAVAWIGAGAWPAHDLFPTVGIPSMSIVSGQL